MAEMIIPGTYISVRAEGLISAGRIATGVVGVVGTAMSGPIGAPVTLSGFADGRELFGTPDDYNQPDDGANPLSLVRSVASGSLRATTARVGPSTCQAGSVEHLRGAGRAPSTWRGWSSWR